MKTASRNCSQIRQNYCTEVEAAVNRLVDRHLWASYSFLSLATASRGGEKSKGLQPRPLPARAEAAPEEPARSLEPRVPPGSRRRAWPPPLGPHAWVLPTQTPSSVTSRRATS
uniref:Uncharacterized protein n=1 Tax=Ursus americanus TaxID=9643 RepID=A0A452QD61_URSAM